MSRSLNRTKPSSAIRRLCISSLLFIILPSSVWSLHRAGEAVLPTLVVAGDFIEDGHVDLLVNNQGVDNIAIFAGNGTGAFELRGHLPVDTVPMYIATGDINEDGHIDLVVPTVWGYDMLVYMGDGRGGFTGTDRLDGGEPVMAKLYDFNNDGHLDLAATEPEGDVTSTDSGASTRGLSVFLGTGGTSFPMPPTARYEINKAAVMAIEDFDGDGNLDMAVADRLSNLHILLGDGEGGFSFLTHYENTTDRVQMVLSGDVNNDTVSDVLVMGATPENTSGIYYHVFIGDGTGFFPTHSLVTLAEFSALGGGGTSELVDLDDDGNLDLVIPMTRYNPDFEPGGRPGLPGFEIWVLWGDGSGAFNEPPQSLATGEEPNSVVVSDFNEDGIKDIAVTNRTESTLMILQGDGLRRFTNIGAYSTVHPSADVISGP